jgi:hypothetical protein
VLKYFFLLLFFFFFFFGAKEFFLSQVLVKTTENKENSAKIVSPMATYPFPPAHPKRILALGYFGYTKLCCCCPPKFRTAPPHQMARIRFRMGGAYSKFKN